MKVHGTKYQTPCALVVGRSHDDELQFGHVINVLVYSKQVFFEFELMHVQFCEHYHAYALSLPPLSLREKFLIEHRTLPTYHPYRLSLSLIKQYISTIHSFKEQYIHIKFTQNDYCCLH